MRSPKTTHSVLYFEVLRLFNLFEKKSMVDWIDKKVKIILNGNFYYNGVVIEQDENSITIIDKFNERVYIGFPSISQISEVKEGYKNE